MKDSVSDLLYDFNKEKLHWNINKYSFKLRLAPTDELKFFSLQLIIPYFNDARNMFNDDLGYHVIGFLWKSVESKQRWPRIMWKIQKVSFFSVGSFEKIGWAENGTYPKKPHLYLAVPVTDWWKRATWFLWLYSILCKHGYTFQLHGFLLRYLRCLCTAATAPLPSFYFLPLRIFLLRVGGSFTATVDPRRGWPEVREAASSCLLRREVTK